MHQHVWRVLSACCGAMLAAPLLAMLGITGCVKHYVAPRPDQPHAIVKVRRAYHSYAGTMLTESANIGEFQVMTYSRASDLDDTQTTAVRVHPGGANWSVSAAYTHTVSQQVRESYQQQVPYQATETYNCGSYSSSGSSYRSCTRSVTRYRSETKYRTVTKQVTIVDAQCSAFTNQLAEVGHVYLLQFSYTGPDVCSLQCLEQVALPDGRFDTIDCKPAPRVDS